MIRQIRRYSKFGFVLLLPAYFLILANSVLNRHTHVLPNGIMITHAHPLPRDEAGNKPTNHHHSKKGYIFLESFYISYYIISDNLFFPPKFEHLLERKIIFPESLAHEIFIAGNSQRAPPVFA
jgi:hypothetical protein